LGLLHPVGAFFSLAGLLWLRYQSKTSGRHASTADWILGREPRKTKLQQLGELVQDALARSPEPRTLNDLTIVLRTDREAPLIGDIEFRNSGRVAIKDLEINWNNVIAFLAPAVAGWGDRPGQVSAAQEVAIQQVGQPINIALIPPGHTITVRRTLVDGAPPSEPKINVSLVLDEAGSGGVKKHYYVQTRHAVA